MLARLQADGPEERGGGCAGSARGSLCTDRFSLEQVQFFVKGKEETEPAHKVRPRGCCKVIQAFRKRDAASARGKRLPLKGEGVERHTCRGGTAGEPSA